MVSEIYNTQAGLIVAILHFSAGVAFVGFLQGAGLAIVQRKQVFSYVLFALLSLDISILQVSIAQFHTSITFDEALAAQKQVNTLAFMFLPLVFFWVKNHVGRETHWTVQFFLVVSAIGMIIYNYFLPLGLRFETLVSTDIVEFSSSEKLLFWRGEAGPASYPARILFMVVFSWILYEAYQLIRKKNTVSGYLILVGGLFLFSSAYISGFIDHGKLDIVYPGGFGFLVFILLISIIISRDWNETKNHLSYLTYHDSLTGLPNRSLLLDRLEQSLEVGRKEQQYLSLILLDIDRFKSIVAAHGHAKGDKVLIAFGGLIAKNLRSGDTVARIGADHFAILTNAINSTEEKAIAYAYSIARNIHEDLNNQASIAVNSLEHLSASIGITAGPKSIADTATEMLRRAEASLHNAKAKGSGNICAFDTQIGDEVKKRLELEHQLHGAISTNELLLYLQQQVNHKGQLVGGEALIRWNHPERGLIPPNVFIPIAEETKLIIELSKWVFSEACTILSKQNVSSKPVNISVNLSPKHFHDESFVPWLRDLLMSTGADPTQLTIEVTENLMISDVNEVVTKINELNMLGINFSIDDFGTGYSSLSYLKRLPIQELKIDKSFIIDAPDNDEDASLVKTMISIAQNMQLKIVAEGVETEKHAQFLKNLDQNIIHQGYLYGYPEPADKWLEKWVN